MSFLRDEARVWLAAIIVAAAYLIFHGLTDDPAPRDYPARQADIQRSME